MVGYKGWKKQNTTNTLWLADRKSLVVGFSHQLAGNHNGAFEIESKIDSIVKQLQTSTIRVNGLFVNAGFDTKNFR